MANNTRVYIRPSIVMIVKGLAEYRKDDTNFCDGNCKGCKCYKRFGG